MKKKVRQNLDLINLLQARRRLEAVAICWVWLQPFLGYHLLKRCITRVISNSTKNTVKIILKTNKKIAIPIILVNPRTPLIRTTTRKINSHASIIPTPFCEL